MTARKRPVVDVRAQLAGMPLFAGIGEVHLERLAAVARLLDLPGHASLFRPGQPIQEVHCLITGSAKRYVLRSDNVEKVLELVQPGQLLALSEAIVGRHYASQTETLEPSRVLVLPLSALNALLDDDARLATRLLTLLAQQHYAAEFDVMRHRSLSVTQRVLDYLLSLAGEHRNVAGETTVTLGASKRLIAARLDMAPETFSRTLRQLSDDGVIVVNGRIVHIQNVRLTVESRASGATNQLPVLPVHYPRHERGSEDDAPTWPEIVNLCGRHRMLSQRITTAWVLSQRELSTASAQAGRVNLRKYRDEFARNLARVQALDLPESVQPPLRALGTEWQTFATLLSAQDAQNTPLQVAEQVFAQSETVLAHANALTCEAVRFAGNTQAEHVNLAGRNRMQCARMAKLFLFYDWPVQRRQAGQLMDEAAGEFQRNLDTLRTSAADWPEAQAQLAIEAEYWQRFIPRLEAARSTPSHRALALDVLAASEQLLRHADTTVKLYERLSAAPRITFRHPWRANSASQAQA